MHDLYGHDDTSDISQLHKTFEKSHRHCEILSYNAPHYIFQYKIFRLSVSFIKQTAVLFLQSSFINPFHTYFNLRAPPAETLSV
jgi:hypothetical protein